MTPEYRGRTGLTQSELIAIIPNELPIDAVGLWQIIAMSRLEFPIEGENLTDFARRSIIALIEAGASPVRFSEGPPNNYWEPRHCLGKDPATIAENVIAQWREDEQEADLGGLWFALPALW